MQPDTGGRKLREVGKKRMEHGSRAAHRAGAVRLRQVRLLSRKGLAPNGAATDKIYFVRRIGTEVVPRTIRLLVVAFRLQ